MKISRRGFISSLAASGAIASGSALSHAQDREKPKPALPKLDPDSIATNFDSVKNSPRTPTSMPGKYPGIVAEAYHPDAVVGSRPNQEIVSNMLSTIMLSLTGAGSAGAAWSSLFEPKDRIGIKINPVAGKLLANSHELTKSIIDALLEIGVPKENIILWDRREEQMKECGFSEENYPGITCVGTEYMVKEGEEELWKGEDRLDKEVYYEFDIVGEYDEETMPYMINGGTKSYFTQILTKKIDKVINVPILKNAGKSVTLALKNMVYGVTSNTARSHVIWGKYIAEVCAFPDVRDKTVLNIIDGLRGCYEGGPGAIARYIWNPKTVWAATDPVALDHIGWEAIFKKRIAEGVAEEADESERDKYLEQLTRAAKLGLGTYDRDKIVLKRTEL